MKKILLITLSALLMGFMGCNKNDDDDKSSSLKLKIGSEVISLADANFYLTEEAEYDQVEDQSSALTHSYAEVYITDADWTQETSKVTYEVYAYIYVPLDDDTSGDFEMDYETIFNAATRYAYFEVYYNNNVALGWGDTYSWIGWDQTAADGSFSLVVDDTNDDLARIIVNGNMERWDYDANAEPTWTLDDSETDVSVSFDFEGEIIDATTSNARTEQMVVHNGKKYIQLKR